MKKRLFFASLLLTYFSFPCLLKAQIDALAIVPLCHTPSFPSITKRTTYAAHSVDYFNVTGKDLAINGGGYNFAINMAPTSWGSASLGFGLFGMVGKTPAYDTKNQASYQLTNIYGITNDVYNLQPNGVGKINSFWLPMSFHWEWQPIKFGRITAKIILGGRLMNQFFSTITLPSIDTTGHYIGNAPKTYDQKFGDFISTRGVGYRGIQIGLPLGKFIISPYVLIYNMSANFNAENKSRNAGGSVRFSEKQKPMCIGVDIINPGKGFGIGVSYTHVGSIPYTYYDNISAEVGGTTNSLEYNYLSVSLIFYSATSKLY